MAHLVNDNDLEMMIFDRKKKKKDFDFLIAPHPFNMVQNSNALPADDFAIN